MRDKKNPHIHCISTKIKRFLNIRWICALCGLVVYCIVGAIVYVYIILKETDSIHLPYTDKIEDLLDLFIKLFGSKRNLKICLLSLSALSVQSSISYAGFELHRFDRGMCVHLDGFEMAAYDGNKNQLHGRLANCFNHSKWHTPYNAIKMYSLQWPHFVWLLPNFMILQ